MNYSQRQATCYGHILGQNIVCALCAHDADKRHHVQACLHCNRRTSWQIMHVHLQGNLPATGSTRTFAQQLLDRLPGKSGTNGRAPIAPVTHRAQETAARAMLRQNAQYELLLDDDDEDNGNGDASHLPAPTTAAVPRRKEKKLRKDQGGRLQLPMHAFHPISQPDSMLPSLHVD